MRLLVTGALFAFALLLAACGGGGASHIAPSVGGSSPASVSSPTQSSHTRATILLRVPPPAAQNSARRPFYISPNTQSFGVYVAPAGSTASPSPANLQIFPVATPSPCAAASGGGETCTLTVTAPFGNDIFYVAAFAVASPNANSVPLSDFVSGVVNVGATPNPNATPLSFSLNGVIDYVMLTVPSPDPGNTPNTQVFTAGSPAPSIPLGVTAYDSSGNIILADPTITFSPALQLTVIPANMGVGLTVNAQCSGSGAAAPSAHRRRATSGSASINVACAADLANVSFSYDGTVAEDTSDNVIDSAAITYTGGLGGIGNAPEPSPSPAFVTLQSNVISYPVPVPTAFYAYNAWLTPSNGQLLYLLTDDAGAVAGTVSSTGIPSEPGTLSTVLSPTTVTVASDGSYWVMDSSGPVIDCWASYSAAVGGSIAPTQINPPPPGSGALTLTAIASDGSGNIWYTGYDSVTSQEYAGYFAAGGCSTATPSAFPSTVTLNGETSSDSSTQIAGLSNGIAYQSTANGVYVITTGNSGSSVSAVPGSLTSPNTASGVAADGAQKLYAAFYNSGSSSANLEDGSASQLTPFYALNTFEGEIPDPTGLAAFSPTGGTADRLAFPDNGLGALGLISNPTGTASETYETMPESSLQSVVYGQNGRVYTIYQTPAGESISEEVTTSTWNVPAAILGVGCSAYGFFTIDERGDSGPFSVTVPGGTATQSSPNMDHVWAISPPIYGTAFPVTVTDKHGRTETYSVIAQNVCT